MKKEKLIKAKEDIIKMAVEDVEKGKYSIEILQIILTGINDIERKEYIEEQEKNKEQKQKEKEEYTQMIAKYLLK
jgi:gamma-glutamyl-gamma-aminobutyrate hydrolase PuuD